MARSPVSPRLRAALTPPLRLEAEGRLNQAHEIFKGLLRCRWERGEAVTLRYLLARTSVSCGTSCVKRGRRQLQICQEALAEGARAQFPLDGRWHPLTPHLVSILDGFLLYQLRRERDAMREVQVAMTRIPVASRSFPDLYALAQGHHNTALCALKLRKHDEAREHFVKALEICGSMGLRHAVSRIADGLGQLLVSLGKFKEARTFLEASLEIKEKLKDLRGQAISSGALSRSAARSGDLKSAALYAKRVQDIAQKTDDPRGRAAGLIFAADARRLQAQRDLEKASLAVPRGKSLASRALRDLLHARSEYLSVAAMSPDAVFRMNASLGLACLHLLLGNADKAAEELGLAKKLYGEQQGTYPEIEEGFKEVSNLLASGPGGRSPLIRLADHVQEAVDRQRRALEIEDVQRFQRSLLPPGEMSIASVHVALSFEPCSEASGDFYDYFSCGDGRGFAAIGDVSGHGMGAAMLMAPAVMALREGHEGSAAARVGHANSVIVEHAPKGRFITLCAMDWGPDEGRFRMVNAGHPPPVFIGKGGDVRWLEPPQNPAVGFIPGLSFERAAIDVAPGDRLLLYTDGIAEARSPQGIFFETVMLDEIRRCLEPRRGARKKDVPDSAQFLSDFNFRLDRFRGSAPSDDDRTLLLLSF